jgi:hypothetical protein
VKWEGDGLSYFESISLLPTSKVAPLFAKRESHTRKYWVKNIRSHGSNTLKKERWRMMKVRIIYIKILC